MQALVSQLVKHCLLSGYMVKRCTGRDPQITSSELTKRLQVYDLAATDRSLYRGDFTLL